jgi:hypothetical protein
MKAYNEEIQTAINWYNEIGGVPTYAQMHDEAFRLLNLIPDAVIATWPIWTELVTIGTKQTPSVFAGDYREISGNEAGLYFTRHPGHTNEEVLLIEEVVMAKLISQRPEQQIRDTLAYETATGTSGLKDWVHWEIVQWSIQNEPLRTATGIQHSQMHLSWKREYILQTASAERRQWADENAEEEYHDRIFNNPQHHYPTMMEDSMSLIQGRSYAGDVYDYPIRYWPLLRPGCNQQDMAIAISKVKRRKLYDLHHEHTYLSFQLYDDDLTREELEGVYTEMRIEQQEIVAAMYEKYGVSQADSRAPHQHNLQFFPAELVDAGAMLYMGTAPYKPITTITGVPPCHAQLQG